MLTHIGQRSVAFFCMPEIGHFNRLQSLISGRRRGIAANVFTHRNFEPQVARAGGIFFDLFSKYPLEEADDTSFPVPCRFVSFAARYGRQICYDVEKTRPSLLIHDTFTVIGRLVAERPRYHPSQCLRWPQCEPSPFLGSVQRSQGGTTVNQGADGAQVPGTLGDHADPTFYTRQDDAREGAVKNKMHEV